MGVKQTVCSYAYLGLGSHHLASAEQVLQHSGSGRHTQLKCFTRSAACCCEGCEADNVQVCLPRSIKLTACQCIRGSAAHRFM